ncbi:hypothetical protein CIK87_11155 [Prevotella sp. P5-64]|nr:hypothetical protein CIK87_11155 [Prevotella sp. P5-64]
MPICANRCSRCMPTRLSTKWGCDMRYWLLGVMAVVMAACESSSYDSGDGHYSYMQAEMVDAYTADKGVISRVVTDEGKALQLQPTITAKWAAKADTLYRALFYYDYHDAATTVKPRSIGAVPVLRPIETTRPDTLRTDPLGLESAWRSTTGRYINMRLALKAGAKDNGEMGRQTVGVKCDTLRTGSREQFTFTLLHNQNGVPEYYTQVAFVSIPLDERAQEADIVVRVNTYGGLLERRY